MKKLFNGLTKVRNFAYENIQAFGFILICLGIAIASTVALMLI